MAIAVSPFRVIPIKLSKEGSTQKLYGRALLKFSFARKGNTAEALVSGHPWARKKDS